jgi:hypothetical protein
MAEGGLMSSVSNKFLLFIAGTFRTRGIRYFFEGQQGSIQDAIRFFRNKFA